MPKYLVAYYSRSGNTAKVARLLASTLSADLEEICEVQALSGPFTFIASIISSLLKRTPPILPSRKNVADYDVVILGCPVWASHMATPMRSYIQREGQQIRQLALFCTLGGSGGKSTLGQMAALCGHQSIADLMVKQPALLSNAWRGLTDDFAKIVRLNEARPPTLTIVRSSRATAPLGAI